MRSRRSLALPFALACGTLACGAASPAPPPGGAGEHARLAAISAHKCTKCHAEPEPGQHTRAKLEDAFGRHGKRVALSADEWREMVDYLAAAAPAP